MEGENDKILSKGQSEGLEDKEEICSIKSIDNNDVVDDEIDEHGDEKEQQNSSSETSAKIIDQNECIDNSRVAISKAFLDAEGLEDIRFLAHKKMPIDLNENGSGGFDAFFAATLPTEVDTVLLLENADCFGEFIFLICLQAKRNTDLLFVFINSTWLAKCPEESEGIDAMKKVEGILLLQCNYLFML